VVKVEVEGRVHRVRLPVPCSLATLHADVGELRCVTNGPFRVLHKMNNTLRPLTCDADVADAFASGTQVALGAGSKPTTVRLVVEAVVRQARHAAAVMAAAAASSSASASVSSVAAAPIAPSMPTTDAATTHATPSSSAVSLAQTALALSSPSPLHTGGLSPAAASLVTSPVHPSPALASPSVPIDDEEEKASPPPLDLTSVCEGRVRAILSNPAATWTLDYVRSCMAKESDAVLQPLLTEAMMMQCMQRIMYEREQWRGQQLDKRACEEQVSLPSPSPSSLRYAWSCGLCSFLNRPGALLCEICLADPADASHVQAAQAALVQAAVTTPSKAPQPVQARVQPDEQQQQPEKPVEAQPEPQPAVQIDDAHSPVPSAVAPADALVIVLPAPAAANPASTAVLAPSTEHAVAASSPSSPVHVPSPIDAIASPSAGERPLLPSESVADDAAPLSVAAVSASLAAAAHPVSPAPMPSDALNLLAEQVASRVYQQLSQQLGVSFPTPTHLSPSVSAAAAAAAPSSNGSSPSASMTSSALASSAMGTSTLTLASQSSMALSPADLASAVQAAVSTCLAESQRAHLLEMQRAVSEQVAAALAKIERTARDSRARHSSRPPKAFRATSASAAVSRQRRSLSGARSADRRHSSSGTSLESSLVSASASSPSSGLAHSISMPASPALGSLQRSHVQLHARAATPSELLSTPELVSVPPAVPSTASPVILTPQTCSPSSLATSLDLDAYVRLSSLSLADLPSVATSSEALTREAENSSAAAAASSDAAALPTHPPRLQSIASATESDVAQEDDAPPAPLAVIEEADLSSSAFAPLADCSFASSSAVPASCASAAAAAASSSPSSSSLTSDSSTLCMSAADLLSDVRFPPVHAPVEREAKLDILQARGFHNRVFAATLLELNKGDVELTAAQLQQFFSQDQP
jgi:hypothetical protein